MNTVTSSAINAVFLPILFSNENNTHNSHQDDIVIECNS